MKSKLRLEAALLGRRGVGGLKKFAPKFSSLVDRQARKVRNFMLTGRIVRVILLEEIRSIRNMSSDWIAAPAGYKCRFKQGDLVNVRASAFNEHPMMVGAIVMKNYARVLTLAEVYYKGKIWRNIHQDEMSPCRPENDS